MAESLIQRARDIAADTYIRLQVKNPTPHRPAIAWSKHVEEYANSLRAGWFDDTPEVQAVIVALRSVA